MNKDETEISGGLVDIFGRVAKEKHRMNVKLQRTHGIEGVSRCSCGSFS